MNSSFLILKIVLMIMAGISCYKFANMKFTRFINDRATSSDILDMIIAMLGVIGCGLIIVNHLV
jgi:hypothetical protein